MKMQLQKTHGGANARLVSEGKSARSACVKTIPVSMEQRAYRSQVADTCVYVHMESMVISANTVGSAVNL